MTPPEAAAPGYFRTVYLLLATARRRATARTFQQTQLFQRRIGGINLRRYGLVMFVLLMAGVNLLAALAVQVAITAGQRQDAAAHGQIMVDDQFVAEIAALQRRAQTRHWTTHHLQTALEGAYGLQARSTALFYGGDENTILAELKNTVPGVTDAPLRARRIPTKSFADMPPARSLAALVGSLMLVMWSAMLVFQGEGLELEIQRSRHPMWEFLFSHPVPPSAVFLAEILSPLAANPIFYSAPLFVGVLYGQVYGPWQGTLAALLAGIPITASASCLGKALEIGVVLRVTARTRGAMMGLMSWLGYSCMMLLGVGAFTLGELMHAAAGPLRALTTLPWPLLALFLGRGTAGFSLPRGILTCDAIAAAVIAGSVLFSLWGARHGLISQGDTPARPGRAARGRFGKNALYRKEMLWLLRDRNAAVQAILIPLTLAGFQLLNLRVVLSGVLGAWNLLCGTAVLFGVYFLSVLCPKSLASEGPALWIPLTWPHGLENLLNAKARLWSIIATIIVSVVLVFAVLKFPANAPDIALVGAGWFALSSSLSKKAVTLVTPSTENGQTQKIGLGERLAAHLGTFTFSIGVITQQWNLALLGVVFSGVTANATWRSFSARLPYFYDPWSAQKPQFPSAMHAMIAASTLVELGTLLTAGATVALGTSQAGLAWALVYGALTPAIALLAARFLRAHGVRLRGIWHWPNRAGTPHPALVLPAATGAGAMLGLLAAWFAAWFAALPVNTHPVAASFAHVATAIATIPHARAIQAVLGVAARPLTEEFLFRGLVFRTLDRDWGGWRAVLGSAGLFALYHPVASWAPLFLLGVCTALAFRRTGSLGAAVVMHLAYGVVAPAWG